MFDSNFLHWWCQRALSPTRSWGRAEEGVKESCLHSIASECFLWPHCMALSVWRQDWPWEQGTALSSGASEVLTLRCWRRWLQCEQHLWRASWSELRPATPWFWWCSVAFFVHLVNMFLECSVKKKNHLSNLNSVKKEFTCCLHHAGGASELWGHQDVIYSPLNAPLHKGSALLPRIAPQLLLWTPLQLNKLIFWVQIFVFALENASEFLGRSARIPVPHLQIGIIFWVIVNHNS